MREILFRGKTPEGEWVEGLIGAVFTADENRKPILRDFIEFDCLGWTSHTYVYDETVGQYTGLTDKNGKKIFEGDIIDCWSEGINAQGVVRQRIDGLWIIYPAWQNQQFWGLCPNRNGSTTVKIIGNIHDNPELLKGGAES